MFDDILTLRKKARQERKKTIKVVYVPSVLKANYKYTHRKNGVVTKHGLQFDPLGYSNSQEEIV